MSYNYQKEFEIIGYPPLKDPKYKFISFLIKKLEGMIDYLKDFNRPRYDSDGPDMWIQENVLGILEVFEKQGHSGSSAPYCISMVTKLMDHKPLSPLTGDDREWVEVSPGIFQNSRLSSVFKQSDRFDGQAYDIDGKVFWEWFERDLYEDEEGFPGKVKAKTYYTCADSFTPIEFPYMPPDKPEYIYRSTEDENEESEEQNRQGTCISGIPPEDCGEQEEI